MALAENLRAAEAAVEYVKSLNIRAMNRLSDRLAEGGGVDTVIKTNPEQGLQAVIKDLQQGVDRTTAFAKAGPAGVGVNAIRQVLSSPDTIINVKTNAIEITQRRYGNCHEQAQVAMAYVYNTYPNIRPLDLMKFGNDEYDHVWLGIGLNPGWNKVVPDGRNGNAGLKINKYSLREWGPDAVWCDPWQSGGVAFSVPDLIKGAVRNLSAEYKCDTAENVEDGWPMSMLRVN